jgi:hypothetical protein
MILNFEGANDYYFEKCDSSENMARGYLKVLSQMFIKALGTKKETNKMFSSFLTNQERNSL